MATKKISQLETISDANLSGEAILPVVVSDPLIPNRKAKVNQLILTHFSPRYTPGNETSPNDLLNEAKAIFPNTQLAKDFLQIDIKKRCNSS